MDSYFESTILNEEDCILESQLINTKWIPESLTCDKIIEVEILIDVDFEAIKDNLSSCWFRRDSLMTNDISLILLIFLSENSKYCKIKTNDGKIKINILHGLVKVFSTFEVYTFICNKRRYSCQKRMKIISETQDSDTIVESFSDSVCIITACLLTTTVYFNFYCIGFFIWIDKTDDTEDLPVVKVNDDYVDSWRIEKIKVYNNHGFFVRLDDLTLKQFFNLYRYNKYKRDRRNNLKKVCIMNYENCIIDLLYAA